jgi:hypothetical protein
MLQEVREHWTIVILGRWNVGIFTPEWLTKNVFESSQVTLEFGMDPVLPRRITEGGTTLIPSDSSLVLAPSELSEACLTRMEKIGCKILETLKHTPVSAVGMNFAYRVTPAPAQLLEQFPGTHANEFADQQLVLRARDFGWVMEYEGHALNLTCHIEKQDLFIKFNFHAVVQDAVAAKGYIADKIIKHRDKTRAVLKNVFNIALESNQ